MPRTNQQLHDLRRFLYVIHTDSVLAPLISSYSEPKSPGLELYPSWFHFSNRIPDFTEKIGKDGQYEYTHLYWHSADKKTIDFYLAQSTFVGQLLNSKKFQCIDKTFICSAFGRKELPDYFPLLTKETLTESVETSLKTILSQHIKNLTSSLYRTPDEPPIVFDAEAARAAVAAVEQQAALARAQQQRASQHLGDIRMD